MNFIEKIHGYVTSIFLLIYDAYTHTFSSILCRWETQYANFDIAY